MGGWLAVLASMWPALYAAGQQQAHAQGRWLQACTQEVVAVEVMVRSLLGVLQCLAALPT